ncbi:MAG TPA: hypothetical protein PLP50_01805 [Thermoanaerobaculia bacterium]|nr:hypothetical protein [Thermoanaerobaculia bacterium]HQN06979.1 hypothetical protein [Thermoanaerobaculia bacterium]HQP84985.1 hypothetical protein [Thermoanaerobaculia bacterium]
MPPGLFRVLVPTFILFVLVRTGFDVAVRGFVDLRSSTLLEYLVVPTVQGIALWLFLGGLRRRMPLHGKGRPQNR